MLSLVCAMTRAAPQPCLFFMSKPTWSHTPQLWSRSDFLRVPQPEVQAAFERFGLLDERVHFHKVCLLQAYATVWPAVNRIGQAPAPPFVGEWLGRHTCRRQLLCTPSCRLKANGLFAMQAYFRYALPAWRAKDKSPIAVLRMDGGTEHCGTHA